MIARKTCLATVAALLVACQPAGACPICDGATGREVRAGLFASGFASRVLACVAPFPILLGVVALIHGRPGSPMTGDEERGPR